MPSYAYNPENRNVVRAYGRGLAVSTKSSALVCRHVTGMSLQKAKRFLEELIEQKTSISGKHYTGVAGEILRLLASAESNAEFKGLDPARMVVHVSAHKGFTYYRPRGMKRRREKKKVTNLQVVLEQR